MGKGSAKWKFGILYTEGRIKQEKRIFADSAPKNRFHLVVHVWIVNAKGEYLISQRAASRPSYPLMWECVGGSVLRGESSVDGAVREVKEEVGIDLSPAAGILVDSEVRKIVNGTVFNDIKDVWLFPYDGRFCWKTQRPRGGRCKMDDKKRNKRILPLRQAVN